MDINTYGAMPGIGSLVQTTEAQVWSGRETDQIFSTLPIKSTVVDAGNTPTTSLRPGLILGKKTSDGLLYAYNPDAADGTEIAYAVLAHGLTMLDSGGTAIDKLGHVLIGGILKAASLITGQDGGLDGQARVQLLASGRFLFDDDLLARHAFGGRMMANRLVITNATVDAADNGTRFVKTTADGTFTLPALAAGLAFEFLSASDHEMVIASAEGDNMIVGNDLSADSVTFTTAGEQIGACVRVESIYVGTTLKWLVSIVHVPFGTNSGTGLTMALAT